MPIDCDDKNLSREEIERLKYVLLDDGTIAKRVVAVTGGDPIDCNDAKQGNEVLYRRASVKLGDRQYADRIIIVT